MRSRNKLLLTAALAALAIPVLAQDRPESILPPGFDQPAAPANSAAPATTPASPATTASPAASTDSAAASSPAEEGVVVSNSLDDATAALVEPVKQVEIPDEARRDVVATGALDPQAIGLGANPWGAADGKMLEILLRRMDGPLASRWTHIALRNALLARAPAPYAVNPVDWTAERAWLLLRLGEADAARMLVAGVDVDRFTPKMFQVATQSALASADPSAFCPIEDGLKSVEPRIAPMVRAICASLTGNAEAAAADIEQARRRGRIGGIDLALADKLVGAGADTARAVTIEWEPVSMLTAWRFGLASATGMTIPDRLLDKASPQLRAWQARAPMLSAESRLPAARIATGYGVLSSDALVDLYAQVYDATDPDSLGGSDAWQLRLAFVGKDQDARLSAMRKLWGIGKGPIEKQASYALLARAATRVAPDDKLQSDAPDIIASLLAAGLDEEAARWIGAVRRMDDGPGDKCWAMLALGAPSAAGLDLSFGRIDSFLDRDTSKDHVRGGLLVAGLVGLGRIDARTAGRLDSRYGLGLAGHSSWTDLIDGASRRRQAGTALILSGTAMQAAAADKLVPLFQYHAISALSRTGQDFTARMVAAEALART